MANALAGPGTEYSSEIIEGKVSIRAATDGLLKINKEALLQFNMVDEVMCATLQSNTLVSEGEAIVVLRLIPLVAGSEWIVTSRGDVG